MNRAGRRRLSGQSLVEFAFVAPIFFLMLLGVMEGGRLMWMNHELTNGTREAARYAMVHGSEASGCVTLAALTQEIIDSTTSLQSGRLSATANTGPFSPCPEPGSTFVVEYQYNYDPMLGLIPGLNNINLSARSQVLVQH
ncbi:MAG TPA: TadE/TadG family type IV pilus assembly protein [Thermomicrobiales bacterium]|nr:TadE/TadG family type IV pilus assembly protein [Thermomicrobiales bacterium]